MLRERLTADATEDARVRAAMGLTPVASRGPTGDVLHTAVGTFGVPVGWEVLGPAGLQMWRDQSLTSPVGAMVRSDPAPTSIVDITPWGGWPADPRDFLRIATDLAPQFTECFGRDNVPIREGPGTLMVDRCPAVWFYQAGSADGIPLMNAHVWALVTNEVVAIQLMAAATNFGRLLDDFWTTVATARWR